MTALEKSLIMQFNLHLTSFLICISSIEALNDRVLPAINEGCDDNSGYEDPLGKSCADWGSIGGCDKAPYTTAQVESLEFNCPVSCRICTTTNCPTLPGFCDDGIEWFGIVLIVLALVLALALIYLVFSNKGGKGGKSERAAPKPKPKSPLKSPRKSSAKAKSPSSPTPQGNSGKRDSVETARLSALQRKSISLSPNQRNAEVEEGVEVGL